MSVTMNLNNMKDFKKGENNMKTNNKGFSHIEIAMSLIVVAVIATVGLVVYNKNHNKSNAMTTASTDSIPADLTANFDIKSITTTDNATDTTQGVTATSASSRYRISQGYLTFCKEGTNLRWGVYIQYSGRYPVQTNAYVKVDRYGHNGNENKNFVRPADNAYARFLANKYHGFVTYLWRQGGRDSGLVKINIINDYGKSVGSDQFRPDEQIGRARACNTDLRTLFTN